MISVLCCLQSRIKYKTLQQSVNWILFPMDNSSSTRLQRYYFLFVLLIFSHDHVDYVDHEAVLSKIRAHGISIIY